MKLFVITVSVLTVICLYLGLPGCSQPPAKMPISTSSTEALDLYVKGRDLAEKLRVPEARVYFEQAAEKDPDFALVHLALAGTGLSTKDSFIALEHAVSLIDRVSDGERYMILSREAEFKRDPAKQKDYLTRLVEAYPKDERGQQLLGSYYFFQNQDYPAAIKHLEQAIKINPEFSPPYNLLGYSYRQLGRFSEAEETFKKYITLIPDEPNPYDSYAELLMKMGRFEESIDMYQRALELNPNFLASYVGIGTNQIFLGVADEARHTFQTLLELAPTSAEKRRAYYLIASSHIYEGDMASGLQAVEEAHSISKSDGDLPAMSEDIGRMGYILLESGDPDRALEKFTRALDLVDQSGVPEEIKGLVRRNHFYLLARVSLAKNDMETARMTIDAYAQLVEAYQVPSEIRRRHEIAGILAMTEKEYDIAVHEFHLADQENPQVLLLLAQAYEGWGDMEKSRETLRLVADFNSLSYDFAFVREKARKALGEIP